MGPIGPNRKGGLLVEVVLFVALVLLLVLNLLISRIQILRKELQNIQTERIPYDGYPLWVN
jgi:hypothetical protein